ncbi:MAG: hypothetical protein FJY85_03125, partial [Deltaproteobacteria bacterium]|nr:hypothetical protein [Deltaproteobacteria bacterium]
MKGPGIWSRSDIRAASVTMGCWMESSLKALRDARSGGFRRESLKKVKNHNLAGGTGFYREEHRMMDIREIMTHPTFANLLPIDQDLQGSITLDMRLYGFYLSRPLRACPKITQSSSRASGFDGVIPISMEAVPCDVDLIELF